MSARIDHVAVAVSNLDRALAHLREVWGLEEAARERVEGDAVDEALLPLGGAALQLIAPLDDGSPVARFLAPRGEGLHHIALEVDDVAAELERLGRAGVTLVDERPRRGGGGRLVAVVHPKGNLGLLVELVQRGT